ncbi:MAG: carboxypeptidase regulatory-like domain-containing protein [Actinobacteria bacterium]|nr:carboxypeptidase regulatory-like domain-containing protein [Actinomycetota bacterium]
MRRHLGTAIGVAGLAAILGLASGCSSTPVAGVDPGTPTVPTTAAAGATTTTAAPTTTTTTTSPTTSVAAPPAPNPRYVVPEGEVEREAKQLAVDIAFALTTYEESDSPVERLSGIAGQQEGLLLLSEASEPLNHTGRWSRGEILYPQMGGLRNGRASVMVVARQTVGSGSEPEFSVVRTLDIRVIMGDSGWEFDALASAGGAFDTLEDLTTAHAVAADSRIDMPDSARLDILGGEISPILLQLMSELADITPYGVTVMATGHPYHVFETDRVSHHTVGRAIDIHRVGARQVIDDRDVGSAAKALVERLWMDSRVDQVGSPWDIDGGSRRSFSDIVHQDHIHLAVIGPDDPDWVPAIGDLVWEDLDADGVQDHGERGIGGVTVRLFNATGTRVASTVTDDDGEYAFRNLTYGEYHVEIGIPDGFVASPRNQGSDDSADSDIDAAGVMASTTLDPREYDPSWDAGLYRAASIGDLVWEDLDADGVQDPGEEGIGGVTVRLFDATGTRVASTVTDDDGEYGFAGLKPGAYHIEIDLPDGLVASPRNQGSDDDADSDIDAAGVMASTTLDSHEDDPGWDAGLYRGASIGDFVWEDLDADGVQDPGEEGIGGITVRLFDAAGARVASTVTHGDGKYAFVGLPAGKYHIEIGIPNGLVASRRNRGSDDTADSDINAAGVMASTTLTPGEHDPGWDAGLSPG